MYKYIFLTIFSAFFLGCSPSSSSDNSSYSDDTTDTYIDYAKDTIVNPDIKEVPHTKSSIPMLGILVSYSNQQIVSSDSVWKDKLFGTSDHQLNHYYGEVSNYQFQFARATESSGTLNDGIVSVTLNKNHPDTSIDNFFDFEKSVYPDLKTALESIDNEVDFSNYDSDGNGFITPDELLLTFIIAGYEDAYEGKHVPNAVWGHQYCTNSSSTALLDGVSLMGCQNNGNFAIFGERHNIDEPHDATVGIIAHELGHSTFSLPDLYNTTGSSGGIGYFGIMGAGTWTRANSSEFHGNTPTHFSAWSKVFMKWVTPVELKGYSTLKETASDEYKIIKVPISANYYYLIENRNNSGYDRGLYSLTGEFNGGIAIWHINENRLTDYYLENNSVNNETNDKAVDLVEAEDTNIDLGQGGGEKALFYSPHINSFKNNYINVTDISTRGSTMSLNIN